MSFYLFLYKITLNPTMEQCTKSNKEDIEIRCEGRRGEEEESGVLFEMDLWLQCARVSTCLKPWELFSSVAQLIHRTERMSCHQLDSWLLYPRDQADRSSRGFEDIFCTAQTVYKVSLSISISISISICLYVSPSHRHTHSYPQLRHFKVIPRLWTDRMLFACSGWGTVRCGPVK